MQKNTHQYTVHQIKCVQCAVFETKFSPVTSFFCLSVYYHKMLFLM